MVEQSELKDSTRELPFGSHSQLWQQSLTVNQTIVSKALIPFDRAILKHGLRHGFLHVSKFLDSETLPSNQLWLLSLLVPVSFLLEEIC